MNTPKSQGWIKISDPAALPKKPVISALMLAYRHEQYITEAIEGVLIQRTDFPIELVIAEDCSPDQTMAIAKSYQKRYPALIRIITSDHNVGASANFLRALNTCRGEYIAICEGDDYWIDPTKLMKQATALKNQRSIDLTFHSTYARKFDTDDLIGPFREIRTQDGVISVTDVITGDGEFIPTASILARKSAFDRIPTKIMQSAPIGDYILQVYGSLRGGAYYINRPMSVYRKSHPESWSERNKGAEKQIEFENAFIVLVNEMDNDIKNYRASFSTLVFNHYFPRYITSIIERNSKLRYTLGSALQSRVNDFSLTRKAKFHFATTVGPLALKTIRATRSRWKRRG